MGPIDFRLLIKVNCERRLLGGPPNFGYSVWTSTCGPERRLLRDSDTSGIGSKVVPKVFGASSEVSDGSAHPMEHQTTNLGVRSSNLFGRANRIKDLRQFRELGADSLCSLGRTSGRT